MKKKLFEELCKLDLFKENKDIIDDLIDYIIDDIESGYEGFAVESAIRWCETELEEEFNRENLEHTFKEIFKKFSDDDSDEDEDEDEYEYDDSDVNKKDSIKTLKKVIDLNKVYNCFSDIDIPVGSKGYFSDHLYNIAVQVKENSKKYSLKEVNTTSNEEDIFKSSDDNWYSYFYCTSTFETVPLDVNDNLIGKILESKKLNIKTVILSQDKDNVYFIDRLKINSFSYQILMEDEDLTIDGKKCQKIKIISK